jgi:four helix bundle protein
VLSEGSRGQGFKGSSEVFKNYKGLNVWPKSYKLCLEIYRITAKFPNVERYGLTSQIRRSAVSIPSNIAEGYGRKTTVDYIRMLCISYSSVCELGNPDIITRGFRFH